MELLFFLDPKTKGCGKKTGCGVIWVEKCCSIAAMSNPVTNRHKWQQALLMWQQAQFPKCYTKGYFEKLSSFLRSFL